MSNPLWREIPLTQGKVAIVDAADYEWLSQFRWRVYKGKRRQVWYAVRHLRLSSGKWSSMRMHREILGALPGQFVDHKDGDGLNNTRSNLRICTSQQNQFNTPGLASTSSRFKGVSWEKRRGWWIASIRMQGKSHFIGSYHDEIDAARAYDAVAKELHGEFARLNFKEDNIRLCRLVTQEPTNE